MDAVLDLTVGRGSTSRHSGLRDVSAYSPSGQEPAAIHPYSRSGRFLAVKPADAVEFNLAPRLSRAALDAVVDGTDSTGDAAEDFRRDFAVATGAIDPRSGDPATAGMAIAESFRAIYPALVNKLSFTEDYADFGDYMSTLDRVIYGLPIVNARILIQLFDAGIVTTDTTVEHDSDFTVDAIIPPAATPPLKTLRNARLAPDSNLAAAGRVTEGWIHGNDTLTRDYHEVIPNWAFSVYSRATSPL
ncbi:hypothetical protein H0194_02625 [Corynebacterium incognita]|uniref:Uncharacterized protein n=1 Tax=Corynebacterium incognita TaxID=2754725 RepID=A0A7G7CQT0_9CORY|nr:hypothetical protein [Corynebacterium incognita]QNE89946.1 hypothetical protein H0194_02625 [Corynebacterium incognita]